jgi:hypothetical protein
MGIMKISCIEFQQMIDGTQGIKYLWPYVNQALLQIHMVENWKCLIFGVSFHVRFQQYLRNCLSDLRKSPFMTLCKPVFHNLNLVAPDNLQLHTPGLALVQFYDHFSQTVGLHGRAISLSQGIYLNT